jgi:hypothetical protein
LKPDPRNIPPECLLISIATTPKDQPEVDRLTKGIIKILKKAGCYEPAIDNILANAIAVGTIYLKKVEGFLDAETATEHTFVRGVDMQLKYHKMIESAMQHLAITRRDRLGQRGMTDLETKLRQELAKASKA